MAKTILSNSEVVTSIGLPESIITDLQTAQGDTFTAVANQFLNALVNKIVYQKVERMVFDNPFKKYDSYPINYGETIENVFVDKAMGDKFNKDATDPFAKVAPDVKSLYVSINYEMQYPVTIQDSLIRRCALNEFGFMRLIDAILTSLVTGRSVDEYLATIIMLNNSDIYANGFEMIDVAQIATEKEKYAKVTETLVGVYHDFALPSIDNNKRRVLQVTSPENTLLVIKQSVLDKIDIVFLAGLFNLSKVDMMKKIIPVRSFQAVVNTLSGDTLTPGVNGADIDFVIVDERGFDCHVALEDGGFIYNPRGKYTNHFSNLWKVISYRQDFQARAFKINYDTYTVSFDANGGTGSMSSVTTSGKYSLPACTLTAPSGKVFDKWQVGTEKYAVGDTIDVYADTTVKATWKNA